jgi:outer membrane protein TolC
VIFQAGVTLPLWFWRDEASIRQARALLRAADEEHREASLSVRRRVAAAWVRLRNAERLDRLYREVLLPRASAAVRAAEDLLASGEGSETEALETVAVLKNFRLAAARARADHGQSVAELEAAIGRPFEGVAR